MTTTKKNRQTNKTKSWAWRGGWAIKSTCCPYRGPRFDSPTHTHGDSELAIVPVQGIFWLPQAPGTRHMWWTDTHTHKIKKKKMSALKRNQGGQFLELISSVHMQMCVPTDSNPNKKQTNLGYFSLQPSELAADTLCHGHERWTQELTRGCHLNASGSGPSPPSSGISALAPSCRLPEAPAVV